MAFVLTLYSRHYVTITKRGAWVAFQNLWRHKSVLRSKKGKRLWELKYAWISPKSCVFNANAEATHTRNTCFKCHRMTSSPYLLLKSNAAVEGASSIEDNRTSPRRNKPGYCLFAHSSSSFLICMAMPLNISCFFTSKVSKAFFAIPTGIWSLPSVRPFHAWVLLAYLLRRAGDR